MPQDVCEHFAQLFQYLAQLERIHSTNQLFSIIGSKTPMRGGERDADRENGGRHSGAFDLQGGLAARGEISFLARPMPTRAARLAGGGERDRSRDGQQREAEAELCSQLKRNGGTDFRSLAKSVPQNWVTTFSYIQKFD